MNWKANGFQFSVQRSAFSVQRFLVLVEPAAEHGVADDVDAAVHVELAHGVGLVRLDRLDAQVEVGGYLLVAVAEGDEAEHLRLSVAEVNLSDRLAPGLPAEVARERLARDGRVEVVAARGHRAHG